MYNLDDDKDDAKDDSESSSSSASVSASAAAPSAAVEENPLSLETVDNEPLMQFIRSELLQRIAEYHDEVLLVLGCRHRKLFIPTKQAETDAAIDSTEVFVSLDEKKLTPRKLRPNYVIIVTRHRLYMIKAKMKGLLRKQLTMLLVRDLHLFLLRKMYMSTHAYCADVAVLQFAGKLGTVCVRTQRLRLLLDTIRRSHRRITVGLPHALAPAIHLPQPLAGAIGDPVPALPARGFRECYYAHCDVRRVTPNEECAMLACEAADGRTFDLALLPGIDGAEEENDCDWAPLMAALKYNDFFRVLELRNVNLRDRVVRLAVAQADRAIEVASSAKKKSTNALNAVVDVLATNRFITKLVLVDTGVSDFEELSKALIANQLSALAHIDLSSNRLSKASIVGLCRALRTRPVGVRSLLLSKVNIVPASAALLVAALESHLRAALTIEHLDLSQNELGPKGSAAVSHFLVCLKGFGKLTWLDLSHTALDVGAIAPVLGVLTTLQHVDISGNVLPAAAAADDQLVADLCGVVALPQLRSASFAAMRLGAKAVQAILLACRSTSQRDERRLALNLSANELAARDIDALVAALASVRLVLVSLAVADCRIGAAGLSAFLSSLQRSDRLERLDIGGNMADANKEARAAAPEVVSSVINFLVSHPTLRELDLSRNAALRGAMPTLLQSLKSLRLHTLLIGGIPMSDASMSALAVSLRLNRSLATLDLTDCRVSLSGWQSFRSAMRQNHTLQNLRLASGASPFEALDAFRRAVPSTYTGRRLQLKEAEVFALHEDIRASLGRNRHVATHESVGALEDKRTLYDVLNPALLPAPGLVKLADLPPHLVDSADATQFESEIREFQLQLERSDSTLITATNTN
jgi:Ran GTPase-activating protein (RanGAP) involved in mRNA processing and transport